ncbi:MAG: hypothetical protein LRS47_02655 [Desulfurococcales archaeon]|nr:hypothetical protein [Desulfurococcales archaeon]
MEKIIVAGLGVSGSRISVLLSRAGFHVEGYDPDKYYRKPCGEAVPVNNYTKSIVEKYTSVKARVSRFQVVVDGKTVYDEEFKEPLWYIIDKHKLVSSLRREAVDNGAIMNWAPYNRVHGHSEASGVLTIDARGPFTPRSVKPLPVFRVIYRPRKEWPRSKALVEFDSKALGFYWIFPSDPGKNLVNAGGGFYELRRGEDLVPRILSYINRKTGLEEAVVKSASLIRIKPAVRLYDNDVKVFYLGEAAGFIVSMTGEGIRPALLSAEHLADSIKSGDGDPDLIARRYREKASSLIAESRLASKLFSIVEDEPPHKRRFILENLPARFWEKYFRAEVSVKTLIGAALLEPAKGVRLLPYAFRVFL